MFLVMKGEKLRSQMISNILLAAKPSWLLIKYKDSNTIMFLHRAHAFCCVSKFVGRFLLFFEICFFLPLQRKSIVLRRTWRDFRGDTGWSDVEFTDWSAQKRIIHTEHGHRFWVSFWELSVFFLNSELETFLIGLLCWCSPEFPPNPPTSFPVQRPVSGVPLNGHITQNVT